MQNIVEIGKTYAVNHSHKGRATVVVLESSDPWIVCRVVEGHFQGRSKESRRGVGDELSIRDSLATFTLVD